MHIAQSSHSEYSRSGPIVSAMGTRARLGWPWAARPRKERAALPSFVWRAPLSASEKYALN
eukprot:6188422-Pleurochrysis_carterae.AAC.2